MPTVTKFANANTVVTTGWTSATNAYADDSVYATAVPAKNGSITTDYGFPAFTTTDIPAGSVINSVTIEIQFKVSTTASIAKMGLQINNNGTLLGTENVNSAEPTVDTLLTAVDTGTITQANLQTANGVKARVHASRGSTNTSFTGSLDYVKITVDYTATTTYTDTPAGAAAATGSVTESWVHAIIYNDSISGLASPTGSVTESHISIRSDSPSGSATASGSISQMLTRADSPTGAASAAGSLVESWSKGYTDSPVGAASSSGSKTDSRLTADTLTGSAAAIGSKIDSWVQSQAVSGGATASGSNVNTHVYADTQAGAASSGGSATDSYTFANSHSDAPTGGSSASGSLVSGHLYTDTSLLAGSAQGSLVGSHNYASEPAGSSAGGGLATDVFVHSTALNGPASAYGFVTEEWYIGSPPVITFSPGKCQGKSRFKAQYRDDDWWA